MYSYRVLRYCRLQIRYNVTYNMTQCTFDFWSNFDRNSPDIDFVVEFATLEIVLLLYTSIYMFIVYVYNMYHLYNVYILCLGDIIDTGR